MRLGEKTWHGLLLGLGHPPVLGPIEAATLIAVTLLFAWLARASRFR